jgi:hypothetical protein
LKTIPRSLWMFIGHFALGFASKRLAPELPLANAKGVA